MINKKLINWWELSPKIHLELTKEFLQVLKNTRIKMKISIVDLAKELEVTENCIYCWEIRKRGISVGYLIKILDKLKIPKSSVYRNIISIYPPGKGYKILSPSLPYKEMEEHIQIICHGIFDGTEEHAESRTNGGIIYQSTKELEQEMFKILIKKCNFGQFNIKKSSKGEYRFPSILAQLLLRHYKFSSLNSKKAIFPIEVMKEINQNKQLRRLILKACFIDEGSCGYKKARDNLCVYSSINTILIEQISNILKLMNYSFFVNKPRKGNCISIYLHSESLPKFYKEIGILLPNEYYKRKNAKILLKRQKRENNIKLQLQFLKNLIKVQKYIKISQIQKLLDLHEASARRRIARLIKSGIIIKISRGFYEAK